MTANMESTKDDTFKCPKLTGENYHTWKTRAKGACLRAGCWEAVVGWNSEANNNAENNRRTRLNDIATGIFYSIVSDSYLDDISECETAKEIWKLLEDLSTDYGLLDQSIFLTELCTMRKNDDISVHDYFSSIGECVKKLKKCGFALSDGQVAAFCIRGLPTERFEGLIRSLERELDNGELTTVKVKAKLLQEEKRCKADIAVSQHHALKASKREEKECNKVYSSRKNADRQQNKQTGNEYKQKKKYIRFCYACGSPTHISTACPKIAEERERQDKLSQKTNLEKTANASVVTRPYTALYTRQSGNKDSPGVWILDGGASDHMTPRRDLFTEFSYMSGEVIVGDGAPLQIEGKGTVRLRISDECGGWDIDLCDVLFVPQLQDNLISQGTLEGKGLKIVAYQGVATIYRSDQSLIKALRVGHLYYVTTVGGMSIQCIKDQFNENQRKASRVSFSLWHDRLGHLQAINKIPVINAGELPDKCDTCVAGKMVRLKFPKNEGQKAKDLLQRIHSDVAGPITPPSIGGNRYYTTFIDEMSRYITVEPMKRKSEVMEKFERFQKKVETFQEKSIKELQSDNGGEYIARSFQEHLNKSGIHQRLSAPYSPQQNGLSERCNLTLMNVVRCLLFQSGAPHSFWAEAVKTAAYLRNRCPSEAIGGRIPLEIWLRREVKFEDYKHLRVFGCQAWAWEPNPKGKLGPRATECVMIGYQDGSKAYRLWDIKNSRIIISRDVVFREDKFPFKRVQGLEKDKTGDEEFTFQIHSFFPEVTEEIPEPEDVAAGPPLVLGEPPDPPDAAQEMPEPGEAVPRRSDRLRKGTECSHCKLVNCKNLSDVPKTAQEALEGPEAEQWRQAMEAELNNMQQQGTWEIVKRPMDRNVIGSKWVFVKKRDQEGNVVKFKARLVAQGFSQIHGIDYTETFSPVIHKKTIRVLMAIAIENDWQMKQYDVVGAYLNSPLEVTVFMEQAPCMSKSGMDPENFVYKLLKSVYGLKQAGRNWNSFLKDCLLKTGLNKCKTDPCVYFSESVIVGVYVDDFLVIGLPMEIENFKIKIQQYMEVKDLGNLHDLLSLKCVKTSENTLTVSQERYITDILFEFGMNGCKGVSMPLEVGSVIRERCTNETLFDKTLYRKAIGCLLYLAGGTRPDISNAVCRLSQYCEGATKEDWKNVQHVFRYLCKTNDHALHYRKTSNKIKVYSDADWGNDRDDGRSFSGYVIILGGGPVIWRSKKQSCVASSSTQAEYMAMYHTVTEVQWLTSFLNEIGQSKFCQCPVEIMVDNRAAMAIACNDNISDRSKHFRIKFFYIKETVENGEILFKYVSSEENIADLLTKPLSGIKTKHFCIKLDLCS